MEGERVCVTGGSGYLANHIIKALLEHPDNFVVVTTVRNKNRVDGSALGDFSRKYGPRLIFEEADLTKEGSFDKAVNGCQYVLHVASPLVQAPKDVWEDLIKPAVQGTLSVLRSCSKTDSVKRVVLTSSVSAIADPAPSTVGVQCTEDDWNGLASEKFFPYSFSKTEAEKKAWEYVRGQNKFDMVVFNPSMILGPVFHKSQISDGSVSVITSIMTNQFGGILDMNMSLIHAGDIAKAQIWGMRSPKANGRYILSLPRPTSLKTMVETLHQHYPNHYFSKIPIPNWVLYLAMPFDGRLSTYLIANLHNAPLFTPNKYLTDSGNTLKSEKDCLIETAESMKPYGILEQKSNLKIYLLVVGMALAGLYYYYW